MSGRPDHYPRVLIVGHDFNMSSGGGITMSCLFGDWPRDCIAVASGGQALGTSGSAGHYYRLGTLEYRWVWPLSAVPRESWKVSGPVAPEVSSARGNARSNTDGRPSRPQESSRGPGASVRRIGSATLRITGANDLLQGLYLSDSFRAWVAAYQPDVIYSQLSSLRLVRLVEALARRTGVPVALHFMDDWPSTLYRRGLLAPILRSRLKDELRALIERAAVVMAISDDMALEFSARYGRAFQVFHNALELREWESARRTSWETGRPFEVLYAGRIGTANEASLLEVASAVGSLADSGVSIRLTVLTPDCASPVAQALRRSAHVTIAPAIAHREIPARLAAADLLVLPLDFKGQGLEFARFSMPTKTVEYMASGTPTLVYAPAQNAVSRYAASEGWAWVVGRRDAGELVEGLRLMAESVEIREHLARTSVEMARTRHDASAVREAFRSALQSAAAARGSEA
jgi:glycosyltransferase involved in cell wall biosynthesis